MTYDTMPPMMEPIAIMVKIKISLCPDKRSNVDVITGGNGIIEERTLFKKRLNNPNFKKIGFSIIGFTISINIFTYFVFYTEDFKMNL